MKASSSADRLAERVVKGLDDEGREERIVVWIERRPGALWVVGRAVNPEHRDATLEDDCVVSEEDGSTEKVRPFKREELTGTLERSFFGR